MPLPWTWSVVGTRVSEFRRWTDWARGWPCSLSIGCPCRVQPSRQREELPQRPGSTWSSKVDDKGRWDAEPNHERHSGRAHRARLTSMLWSKQKTNSMTFSEGGGCSVSVADVNESISCGLSLSRKAPPDAIESMRGRVSLWTSSFRRASESGNHRRERLWPM